MRAEGYPSHRTARRPHDRRPSRLPGLAGTAAFHLALVALFLSAQQPVSSIEPMTRTLRTFDVSPPPPPPPPPTPEPPPPPSSKPLPRPSKGGSPAPSRAPITPVSAIALPPVADATLLTDAPLPIPPVAIEGLAIGEAGSRPAAGVGSGGEGLGSGSGVGDGARLAPMRGAAWISYPSEFDLLRSWPMEARRRGISGLVKLSCIVPRPGRPKRCTLLSETPAGKGFGRSALYLWPDFRIRPVMRDTAAIDLPIIVTLAFDFKKPSPAKDAKGKR